MQWVLDLDLDLFVHGIEHFRNSDDDRLDPDEYPPWSIDAALAFLTENCGLSARLPGAVVEHHGEMFGRWRDAISGGHLHAPFEVTHADAHADLGLARLHEQSAALERDILDSRIPNEPDRERVDRFLVDAYRRSWITERH